MSFCEKIWTWRDCHRAKLPPLIDVLMYVVDWILAAIYKTLAFLVYFEPLKKIVFVAFELVRDVVWLIEWLLFLVVWPIFWIVCILGFIAFKVIRDIFSVLGGVSFGTDQSYVDRRNRDDFYH